MSWPSKEGRSCMSNQSIFESDSSSDDDDDDEEFISGNEMKIPFSSLPFNISKCANANITNQAVDETAFRQQPYSNRLLHSLENQCGNSCVSQQVDLTNIEKDLVQASGCSVSDTHLKESLKIEGKDNQQYSNAQNDEVIKGLNNTSPLHFIGMIDLDEKQNSFPESSASRAEDFVSYEDHISKSMKDSLNLKASCSFEDQESIKIVTSIPHLNLENTNDNNMTDNHVAHVTGPLYNWQANMTTMKERFAFLFNNELLSDVHFCVGKGDSSKKIPAHKFVLSVGSAVFDAMFNAQFCTKQDDIELPDVEPQAFLGLLRFLYSDEVQIDPDTVMTILYTAKKYAVPALERQCVEFLKCNLSSDNAFMLLTQARLFDEPQLAALCLDTIDKNTTDALLADGFTDVDHKTLCLVLERDTLRIRELKLYQAVTRWSEEQCIKDNIDANGENQRALLGQALTMIRFPLMTIEEFAQGPAQSDILSDREIVELFLYFTVNPKPPVGFLDVPRCCMTGKEVTMSRFQQIESRWGYSGTSDRIRFFVDKRIFVVGFGMYGSTHGPSEYEMNIQIIHTVTGQMCASNDTSFISDGSLQTFRVMFKEPVEITPNTDYTAYATIKGADSHYGTKGIRKMSVECPSGERVTFQFTYAAGHNNGTSVEDGQIPEIIFYT